MGNIIYKSDNIIPWDTQSAFKMTGYNVSCEEHMIFCYLKAYVHGKDLVLCSYCFTEKPEGDNNIHLYINLTHEKKADVLKIDFGYEGVCSTSFRNMDTDKNIADFRAFKTDDEQGFYWCGEITLKADRIKEMYGISLEENSIFTLNMIQSFDNGDFGALYGNRLEEKYSPAENMELFLILNY